MSKFIHPITLEAAKEVASNLRPDDRREVEEGHGQNPLEVLTYAAHHSSCVYFTVPNGKTAGMAGLMMMELSGCYALQRSMSILSPLPEKLRDL